MWQNDKAKSQRPSAWGFGSSNANSLEVGKSMESLLKDVDTVKLWLISNTLKHLEICQEMLGFSEAFEDVWSTRSVWYHNKAHSKCESIVHLPVRLGAALRSKRLGTDEHVGSFPANLSTTQVRVIVIHYNHSNSAANSLCCTMIHHSQFWRSTHCWLLWTSWSTSIPKSWNSSKEFRKLGIASFEF